MIWLWSDQWIHSGFIYGFDLKETIITFRRLTICSCLFSKALCFFLCSFPSLLSTGLSLLALFPFSYQSSSLSLIFCFPFDPFSIFLSLLTYFFLCLMCFFCYLCTFFSPLFLPRFRCLSTVIFFCSLKITLEASVLGELDMAQSKLSEAAVTFCVKGWRQIV